MKNIPSELKYTKTHEWVERDEDDILTLGITAFAAQQLGDIVYVELPEIEHPLQPGEEFGVVESVKAASDLYSPISGEIIAVNKELSTTPELINSDPYHLGWIIKIQPDDIGDWDELMDAEEYAEMIAGEA